MLTFQDIKKGLLEETFIYFKFLSKVFAAPVAYGAYKLKITANQLTTMGILLSIPSALLNLTGHYILAVLVFHCFFILDASDGVLARGTRTGSVLGAYLDDLAHYIYHTIFFCTLATAFYRQGRIYLAFIVIVFIVTDVTTRAHQDLLDKCSVRTRVLFPMPGTVNENFIKNMIIGSFKFPNVLVWITILCWKLEWLFIYFLYATTMNAMYLLYTVMKTALHFRSVQS